MNTIPESIKQKIKNFADWDSISLSDERRLIEFGEKCYSLAQSEQKGMRWVRGHKRLPGLFTKVKWRNADGGNIPLPDATPLEHFQRAGPNINFHEWLDESAPPEHIEGDGDFYPGHQYQNIFNWLRDQNMISFSSEMQELINIVHRDFPVSDAIEFAEWLSDNQFTRYDNIWTSTKVYYSGCSYTTETLYQLFKQSPAKREDSNNNSL